MAASLGLGFYFTPHPVPHSPRVVIVALAVVGFMCLRVRGHPAAWGSIPTAIRLTKIGAGMVFIGVALQLWNPEVSSIVGTLGLALLFATWGSYGTSDNQFLADRVPW
jgi:hypothetical protein